MAQASLTEAEVWDDSDLLNTWNEAFAEYKKYHSLAAKDAKITVNPNAEDHELHQSRVFALETKDGPLDEDAVEGAQEERVDAEDENDSSAAGIKSNREQVDPAQMSAATSMPHAVLGAVRDEALKSLMMSWYFAGYHTGLYEGKQQGYESARRKQEEERRG